MGKVELTRVDSFPQGIFLFAPEETEERGKTAEEKVEHARRVHVEAVHVKTGKKNNVIKVGKLFKKWNSLTRRERWKRDGTEQGDRRNEGKK